MIRTTLIASCVALSLAARAQQPLQLQVRESAGLARESAPVTTGVPFAIGELADASTLAVFDAEGEPVPSQFRAISSWRDGSVRWALMDCQVSVASRGVVRIGVGPGERPAHESPIEVDDADDSIRVSTGSLEFRVSKTGFSLFRSIRFGDRELVTGQSPGLVLYTGTERVVADGPPDEVVVEERGPLRTVVRIRGRYPGVHDGLLGYTARITAWAGRPCVGLRVWLENHGRYGFEAPPEWFEFDGQAVELDLDLGPLESLQVDGVPVTLADPAEPKFRLAQHNTSNSWRGFRYTVTEGERQIESGDRTGGLVTVASEAATLTVGARYFWENYSKAVELDGHRLKFWLWPTDGQWPPVDGRWNQRGQDDFRQFRKPGVHHLPGCVKKGHELVLDFSGRHPASVQADLRSPLMALASPEHYAGTEAVPGRFAPAGFRTGNRVYDAAVGQWDRQAIDAVDRRSRTSIWTARVGLNTGIPNWFGWMNFGDNGWGGGFSSLHYDWPWIMLVDYARHGRREFFDMGVTMVRHLIEVDHLWSERNHPALRGMARFEYANPLIHGGVAEGRCKPHPSHNWISGIVLYYMLTGDEIARECALSSDQGLESRIVAKARKGPWSTGQARASGWAILCYCSLFDLTGEQAYLDKALLLFRNHQAAKWQASGPFTDGGLQYYYTTQPLCELHERTGDPDVLKMLEEGCEGNFSDSAAEWPVFLSNIYAHVGHLTGRDDYIEHAMKLFAAYKPNGWPACYNGNEAWDKEVGKYLRNGHILQHVLWRRARKD